ncbi:MAG: hypothetical protein RR790_00255 [Eubacterium sp.]
MGAVASGVYPVYENQFQVGIKGVASTLPADMVTPADLETFSVSMDNGVEEWTPMDTEGWIRRLLTAKAITITLSGKRNIGDPGNDYIFGLAFATGQKVETKFLWNFPSGAKLEFASAVVSVTTPGGGDSTGVDALEFDVMSNGKPIFTAAPAKV